MATAARKTKASTPAKRTTRAAGTTRATRRKKAPATTTAASTGAAVDGVEPLLEVLDSDIGVRISGSTLIAGLIVAILLILTAAAGASWLFAIPTIALAFIAGWLAARTAPGRR